MSITIVQPRHMSKFACLGPDCPDTCCKDWVVDVDPATRRLWRDHPDPAWRKRLAEGLVQVRTPDGKERHKVAFREDGHCVFFDEDRLCSIQKEIGAHAMPWICRVFPRGDQRERDLLARSGSIACVAVAREIVGEPKALEEAVEGPLGPTLAELQPPSTRPIYTLAETTAIRRTAVRILQRPTWSWEGRLVLLALFAQELAATSPVHARAELRALPARYEAAVGGGEPSGIARTLERGREEVPFLLAPVLRSMIAAARVSVAHKIAWLLFLAGALDALGVRDTDPETAARNVVERVRACRAILEREHPAAQANLLGTLLHQVRFPGARPKEVVDRLARAVVAFAIWRLLVTARLAAKVEDPREAIAQVTWKLGRELMHSSKLLEQAIEGLRRGGALAPARLALLAV